MDSESYSTPSSSVRFSIHSMDDIVPVERRRYHRCTLVEAVIAPGLRLEIPCFWCTGHACHGAYLRSVQAWLALHLQCAYFPRLPLSDAQAAVRVFTSTVLLPTQSRHLCPAPFELFTSLRLATVEFEFRPRIPNFVVGDESVILETLEEAQTQALPATTPASKSAVVELVMARAEEEVREGALFGRGWSGAGHDCVICMEEIGEPRKALKLPCRHVFHEACLLRWFENNHVCPLCRRPMPTDD